MAPWCAELAARYSVFCSLTEPTGFLSVAEQLLDVIAGHQFMKTMPSGSAHHADSRRLDQLGTAKPD